MLRSNTDQAQGRIDENEPPLGRQAGLECCRAAAICRVTDSYCLSVRPAYATGLNSSPELIGCVDDSYHKLHQTRLDSWDGLQPAHLPVDCASNIRFAPIEYSTSSALAVSSSTKPIDCSDARSILTVSIIRIALSSATASALAVSKPLRRAAKYPSLNAGDTAAWCRLRDDSD